MDFRSGSPELNGGPFGARSYSSWQSCQIFWIRLLTLATFSITAVTAIIEDPPHSCISVVKAITGPITWSHLHIYQGRWESELPVHNQSSVTDQRFHFADAKSIDAQSIIQRPFTPTVYQYEIVSKDDTFLTQNKISLHQFDIDVLRTQRVTLRFCKYP